MAQVRTHYDNLQVARNASPEVIRAAYKGLSQRFHPDRNPQDRARCEHVMKLINAAYGVLSDPAQRSAHDAWIAREEEVRRAASQPVQDEQRSEPDAKPTSEATSAPQASRRNQASDREASPLASASRTWEANAICALAALAFTAKFLASDYGDRSLLLLPNLAVICFLLLNGVREQRSGHRILAASSLAIGAGIADATINAYALSSTQIAQSYVQLFAGATCWFVATYAPLRVAMESIAGSPQIGPQIGRRAPLSLVAACLLFAASNAMSAVGSYFVAPAGIEASFEAVRSTPPYPWPITIVALVVGALLFVAVLSVGTASLLLRLAAPLLRFMRFSPSNRSAWALIVVTCAAIVLGVVLRPDNGSAVSSAHASGPRTTMQARAQYWFRIYPFLDENSPLVNKEAINAVVARRNELIAAGYEPVAAMDQACAEVAPRYATH